MHELYEFSELECYQICNNEELGRGKKIQKVKRKEKWKKSNHRRVVTWIHYFAGKFYQSEIIKINDNNNNIYKL